MKRGDLQSNGLPQDGKQSGGDSEPRPADDFDAAAELELIDAALSDDKQAFSDLFERYRPDLYALCFQRLNDHSLAEDVVQEAFIRVLTHLPTFDRSKRFWPWLATIAVRMCTDLQRRRSFTHYSGDIGVSLDNGVHKDALERQTGPAPDAVIASEEREEFLKSLDVLPKRQRRAFVLYTLDGLSCADIAAAEGVSVGAVHRLLYRARKKLRATHPSRPLPAIVLPFTWLRWKVQQIEERVRPYLGVYSEGFSTACAQAVCLGTVAAMLVATGNYVEPFDGNVAVASNETVLLSLQSPLLQTASRPTALSGIGAATKAPVEPQQPVADPGSLADGVINPNQNATPENKILTSITASPNYENDHTILASGSSVIFVSNDGGASWKPLPSRLLSAYDVAFTPGYPQDRRIFAQGDLGLLQSDDGGGIFRPASPLMGNSLAISPSFGREDSKILVGGKIIFDYDAATGIARPGSLNIPPSSPAWGYSSITFSPGYPSDPTIFVTDNYRSDPTLYLCKLSVCDKVQFPGSEQLTLKLSPQFDRNGLAYVRTPSKLLASGDGGQTFREIQFPSLPPVNGFIADVAILWSALSDPAIFAAYGSPPSVYRSLDGGRSWDMTLIDIPGFRLHPTKLLVTPTGRLLATGDLTGLACSVDWGKTWARRCPPEL